MQATITIARYKKWAIPFAFLSMVAFRIPLYFNKRIKFHKLMGSGRNGTFDILPDLHQWAIFTINNEDQHAYISSSYLDVLYGKFIIKWLKIFSKEIFVLLLEPIKCHGLWDNEAVFGELNYNEESNCTQIGVLTRATIRLSKLKEFWKSVPLVSSKMKDAKGLMFSIGIGEIPWIKQATFSIWETEEDMKQFAYRMKEHSQVIKNTRVRNWYAEEMFVRFNIIDSYGTIHGKNPLKK